MRKTSFFFFSSRRRHTRSKRDWSSDVCSSDLSQVGVLVGYLARRVLGQYDIALLGEASTAGGKLYFVEPNLQQVEETLGVPPDELRRWIALHEATHAHEFELYPWVRPYLNGSLRQYLRLLIDDMRGRGEDNTMLTIANR